MGTAKRDRQKAARQARLEALQVAEKKRRTQRSALRIGLALVAIVVLALVLALVIPDDDDDEVAATDPAPTTVGEATGTATGDEAFTYGTGACPPAEGVAEPVRSFDAAPQLCIDPARSYTAVLETSEGTIEVALDTERTPGTANNFVVLARNRYYDGTPVFRTDPSIAIIQAGGESPSDPGPGYSIPDEGGSFTYEPGDLVMARTAAPDSAGAQFFFVAGPEAAALDAQGTYVTFGEVTTGLDVVQAILGLHEDQPDNPLGGAPSRPVTIEQVTIREA